MHVTPCSLDSSGVSDLSSGSGPSLHSISSQHIAHPMADTIAVTAAAAAAVKVGERRSQKLTKSRGDAGTPSLSPETQIPFPGKDPSSAAIFAAVSGARRRRSWLQDNNTSNSEMTHAAPANSPQRTVMRRMSAVRKQYPGKTILNPSNTDSVQAAIPEPPAFAPSTTRHSRSDQSHSVAIRAVASQTHRRRSWHVVNPPAHPKRPPTRGNSAAMPEPSRVRSMSDSPKGSLSFSDELPPPTSSIPRRFSDIERSRFLEYCRKLGARAAAEHENSAKWRVHDESFPALGPMPDDSFPASTADISDSPRYSSFRGFGTETQPLSPASPADKSENVRYSSFRGFGNENQQLPPPSDVPQRSLSQRCTLSGNRHIFPLAGYSHPPRPFIPHHSSCRKPFKLFPFPGYLIKGRNKSNEPR